MTAEHPLSPDVPMSPDQVPSAGGIGMSDPAPDRLAALVPGLLASVLAGLSLAHVISAQTYAGQTWALVTGSAALVLAVVAFAMRRRVVSGRAVHLALALCLLAAAGDALLFLTAHGSLERTGEVMLVVACSGALLASLAWYRATAAVICAAWAAAALTGPPNLLGFHLVAIVGSTAMARTVRLSRTAALAANRAQARALEHARRVTRAQAEALALARDKVRDATVVDPLTGLPDRNGLELIGKHLVAIARREGGAVGCTFVSVPGLQDLQDSHGAEAAQALFVHLADTLRSVTRATDVVARWGGARLVVVTHGAGAPMEVLQQRVVAKLPLDCPVAPEAWSRELVLGRSVLEPWDDGGLVSLVAAADADLHTRLGLPAPEQGTDAVAEAEAVARIQAVAAAAEVSGEVAAELAGEQTVTRLDLDPADAELSELVAAGASAGAPVAAWATVIRIP